MLITRETEKERIARYAKRDVVDKLGIKAGQAIRVVGKADRDLLAKVSVRVNRRFVGPRATAEIVLYWPDSADGVTAALETQKANLNPAGAIWVISAKKSGKPYIPDKILIPLGLAAGLVDNKICSISDTQTAMRFVIRLSDRGPL